MTEKKYQKYYDLAGKASFENWESVKNSKMCGCYYCRSIFPSSDVGEEDWTPDRHGRTVLCPKCSIDSVIGDASGIPIREDVLEELYQENFCSNDFPIVKTERLLIRPVLEQDAADILEIRGYGRLGRCPLYEKHRRGRRLHCRPHRIWSGTFHCSRG